MPMTKRWTKCFAFYPVVLTLYSDLGDCIVKWFAIGTTGFFSSECLWMTSALLLVDEWPFSFISWRVLFHLVIALGTGNYCLTETEFPHF